ncbi:uncharacterized protein C11orf52 homolog isoform X1 [Otolemur garnettii]|uniref:uncharacterized protein C11orf52 homolog isoform X1 n=1 Tax=Otolemur garnettii TaxID=30611 RepID=UPI000C7EA467|nr:uncharacterized protein C11orf52 homolog isoform X1 [Otolemur garnettii]
MGNRLCCGGGWSCPSTLPNKKKTGSQEKWTLRMHQEQLQQNGTQGRKITRRTYKQVSWHETRERSQSIPVEDSSLHYADIQLCSRTQPRPAHEELLWKSILSSCTQPPGMVWALSSVAAWVEGCRQMPQSLTQGGRHSPTIGYKDFQSLVTDF